MPTKGGHLSGLQMCRKACALEDGEVHVYRVLLDRRAAEMEAVRRLLSSDEQSRARRYRFARDAERYAVARGALRILLGGYTGAEPQDVVMGYYGNGKPFLEWPASRSPLHFNVSHSHALAVCVFSRMGPLGVDVERIRPLPECHELAARYFSASEQATLAEVPREHRIESFFRCWTRKEAFVKARGDGLGASLTDFDVSLAPGVPARLLRWRDTAGDAIGWKLYDLQTAPGFVGALALCGEAKQVRYWSGPLRRGAAD